MFLPIDTDSTSIVHVRIVKAITHLLPPAYAMDRACFLYVLGTRHIPSQISAHFQDYACSGPNQHDVHRSSSNSFLHKPE
jgi:hypothetical protein